MSNWRNGYGWQLLRHLMLVVVLMFAAVYIIVVILVVVVLYCGLVYDNTEFLTIYFGLSWTLSFSSFHFIQLFLHLQFFAFFLYLLVSTLQLNYWYFLLTESYFVSAYPVLCHFSRFFVINLRSTWEHKNDIYLITRNFQIKNLAIIFFYNKFYSVFTLFF